MKETLRLCAPLAAAILASAAQAAELPVGEKQITLSSSTQTIALGTVNFSGSGPTRQIIVKINDALLTGEFLSMRPFKCLESPTRYYCAVPYPYAWTGVVTADDLTDLEYALLFVQKEPTAYGINLWQGVYYKLTLAAHGTISGQLNEVDLDILAAPPKENVMRPITQDMLSPANPETQWLPSLTIK